MASECAADLLGPSSAHVGVGSDRVRRLVTMQRSQTTEMAARAIKCTKHQNLAGTKTGSGTSPTVQLMEDRKEINLKTEGFQRASVVVVVVCCRRFYFFLKVW